MKLDQTLCVKEACSVLQGKISTKLYFKRTTILQACYKQVRSKNNVEESAFTMVTTLFIFGQDDGNS